jgi:hypothetical protein
MGRAFSIIPAVNYDFERTPKIWTGFEGRRYKMNAAIFWYEHQKWSFQEQGGNACDVPKVRAWNQNDTVQAVGSNMRPHFLEAL